MKITIQPLRHGKAQADGNAGKVCDWSALCAPCGDRPGDHFLTPDTRVLEGSLSESGVVSDVPMDALKCLPSRAEKNSLPDSRSTL